MSVVDASTVVEFLLNLPLARSAERYVIDLSEGAAAPDLLNAEVLHVLGRYERQRLIDATRSRLALDALIDLPVTRYPTLALLDRAWTLRPNFSGYDAMYMALADALRVAIITTDKRLAAAARRYSRVPVVLLS